MNYNQIKSLRECCGDSAAFERLQQFLLEVETQHQNQLQQAEEKIRILQSQLEQRFVFEAMLKRITDKLRLTLDVSQILQTAMQELVETLGVICCDTGLYNLAAGTSTVSYE